MYTKQQAAKLKDSFWTSLGLYLAPILSAEGEKINWINYRTGQKYIFLRMQADNNLATIALEFTHPDPLVQESYWQQARRFNHLLVSISDGEWEWQLSAKDPVGKTLARVYREASSLSIFNKADWPALISFFKQNLMALDCFWSEAKYSFEGLG